jgi:hypothetical protein
MLISTNQRAARDSLSNVELPLDIVVVIQCSTQVYTYFSRDRWFAVTTWNYFNVKLKSVNLHYGGVV